MPDRLEDKLWFDLYILNEDATHYVKVAELFEPRFDDMFWYSYRVEPVSEEADRRIRDERIWNEVAYVVTRPNGEPPKVGCETGPLAGGWDFKQFCASNSNRVSFRSLQPLEERDVLTFPKLLLALMLLPFRLLWILIAPDKHVVEAKRLQSRENASDGTT